MGLAPTYDEQRDQFRKSVILCSTLTGSGAEALAQCTWPTVLVDEAAQAIEPAVLVPLKRRTSRLVLIGDSEQLPPFISCEDARNAELCFLASNLPGSNLCASRINFGCIP